MFSLENKRRKYLQLTRLWIFFFQVKTIFPLGFYTLLTVSPILTLMNVFWFWKILKGMMKTLSKKRHVHWHSIASIFASHYPSEHQRWFDALGNVCSFCKLWMIDINWVIFWGTWLPEIPDQHSKNVGMVETSFWLFEFGEFVNYFFFIWNICVE